MKLYWTAHALSDLGRLYEFLAIRNQGAAARILRRLTNAPTRLLEHPRIGERLDQFEPREVRRVLVGDYEVRYEIAAAEMYVLRVLHTREKR